MKVMELTARWHYVSTETLWSLSVSMSWYLKWNFRGAITSNARFHTVSAVEGRIFELLYLWGNRKHPLKARHLFSKSSLFSFSWLKLIVWIVLKSYKSTTRLPWLLFVLHRNWINREINIPVRQLTVRCRVMFTFPTVTQVVVNTVFSRDCVVDMAALLVAVVIQLCVLHWPLLRWNKHTTHTAELGAHIFWSETRANWAQKHVLVLVFIVVVFSLFLINNLFGVGNEAITADMKYTKENATFLSFSRLGIWYEDHVWIIVGLV